jgi:hypothetical protein
MTPITMLPNTMTAPTVIPVAMSGLAFRNIEHGSRCKDRSVYFFG